MMKKEVKRLKISTTGLVLMVMVAFGSLFSSCYTKDDIPVVPEVEPLKNTYVIGGWVSGYDLATGAYEDLSDVTITSSPAGNLVKTNEAYALYVDKAGTYTLTFSKTGYESYTCTVIVPEATAATGQLIRVSLNITLSKELSAPSTTGAITALQGGSISSNGSTLAFPANSVGNDTQVAMDAYMNIVHAVARNFDGGAQFALGTFGPNGLQFRQATWTVPNPLTNHYMLNTKLQYKATDVDAGEWNTVENGIFYDKANDQYFTTLTHFSQYRMVYMPEDMKWIDGEVKEISMENIANLEDEVELPVKSIEVKKYVGATLKAKNFAWEDYDANLRSLIEAAIRAGLDKTDLSFDGIKEVTEEVALEKSEVVPFNFHMLGKGQQIIEIAEFCFKIYDKATDQEVDLDVEVEYAGYWMLNYSIEYCGSHHHTHGHGHCGHIYNGGAGGGSVDGE